MGSFVRGSVASFRISEDFNQGHLDYLNASTGSKSTRLAKYCSIGLKAEMDESIIIEASNLPIQIRDWLSNTENIKLLVTVLASTKIDATKKNEPRLMQHSELKEVPTSTGLAKPIENISAEQEDALTDFIKQFNDMVNI